MRARKGRNDAKPTPACISTSAQGAARSSAKTWDCCIFCSYGRADARPARLKGGDYAEGSAVYFPARMSLSLVRLVATLLLSGQMLPVGLPLLCSKSSEDAGELRSTNGLSPVWAGGRCDKPRCPVR